MGGRRIARVPSLARRSAAGSLLLAVLLIAGLNPIGGGASGAEAAPAGLGPACQLTQPANCTLRELADLRGMRIGATISASRLGDPGYTNTLATQFNAVTPDNDLKWKAVQPSPGDWEFGAAEADLAFAQANGMEFRGHNLIFNQDANTPAWVEALDPTQLQAAVQTEIQTVVGHFRGRIHRWDVVNEPLATVGTGPQDSVFQRELPSNWIDTSFTLAHQADPSAELWLNDCCTDFVAGKFDALVTLLKGMKKRHIPVYGVGLEGHRWTDVGPDSTALQAQIKQITKLGFRVALTEVDVAIPPNDDAALALQAGAYGRTVGACLAVPRCQDITTWGVDDSHTWLNNSPYLPPGNPRPLLFDANYAPKAAYGTVQSCLARAAMVATHARGKRPLCPRT